MSRIRINKVTSALLIAVAIAGLLQLATPRAEAASTVLPATYQTGGSAEAHCRWPYGKVIVKGGVNGTPGEWVQVFTRIIRLDPNGRRTVSEKSQVLQVTVKAYGAIWISNAAFDHTHTTGTTGRLLEARFYVNRWNGSSWGGWQDLGGVTHLQYEYSKLYGYVGRCVA